MDYVLTRHAQQVLAEREIPIVWVELTLDAPDWVAPDPHSTEIQRYYRRIPEFGNRILRVAAARDIEHVRIVSVFFDRNAKAEP